MENILVNYVESIIFPTYKYSSYNLLQITIPCVCFFGQGSTHRIHMQGSFTAHAESAASWESDTGFTSR